MGRKYKDIDETISGINKSCDSHFKWLVKVMSYLINQESDLPEISCVDSHNLCDFGHWLNEKLEEDRDDKNYLMEIDNYHMNVHRESKNIIDTIRNGERAILNFRKFETSLLDFNESLTKYKTHLLQLRTSYDVLTRLPLRRVLDESFGSVVERFSKIGLYLLLLDIDHFKKINDNYGHLVGDVVLQALAVGLESSVRKSEPVYRYGGEEFIILLHAETESDAFNIAERVREQISKTDIYAGGRNLRVTFSAGLTKIYKNEVLHEVLERADAALYEGKQSGRNCCMYIDQQLSIRKL
ncbi:diguanylate cyclase (plasmid) [Klebsiella aerogenes]|uniref:diguanylate cyclase n=1 Tax=Klebsiella aerogenes TaxID=548 RepID=UPI00124BF036|nr:diguanylate cyclase [Klebsiella aerogenes]QFI19931.1 diguanylate cyclase [Klebsiella aerogenes]